MKMIQSFDPAVAASGSFDHKVSNPCGGVYLFNESNIWLQLRLPGGNYVGLPAWWSRFYRLDEVLESIQWQELATISTVATPLSQVYGEAYESSELKYRTFYDGPIPRNPYIANNVSSNVSTTVVQNDGNPTVSTVIEATQTGNTGGSNLFAGNDGSFYYGQWISGVYTKYFYGVPSATPIIVLGTKTVLQALDNSGANLSNVFGVDSSGNTFIQNHAKNNQTVIYDNSGNQLLKVDSSGNVTAKGNNNNKLSNVTLLATPYQLDNNGSLLNGATASEVVAGVGGIPSAAIAILLSVFFTGSAVGTYLQWKPQGATVTNTSDYPLVISQVASVITAGTVIVPVNTSNQKIDVTAHQGNASGVFSSIYGYII